MYFFHASGALIWPSAHSRYFTWQGATIIERNASVANSRASPPSSCRHATLGGVVSGLIQMAVADRVGAQADYTAVFFLACPAVIMLHTVVPGRWLSTVGRSFLRMVTNG